jgi:hypothetical protein
VAISPDRAAAIDVRPPRREQTGTLSMLKARKIQRPPQNITIQPELVSVRPRTDARFTFGASLTDGVDLTYPEPPPRG